jgi:hypothetical protein
VIAVVAMVIVVSTVLKAVVDAAANLADAVMAVTVVASSVVAVTADMKDKAAIGAAVLATTMNTTRIMADVTAQVSAAKDTDAVVRCATDGKDAPVVVMLVKVAGKDEVEDMEAVSRDAAAMVVVDKLATVAGKGPREMQVGDTTTTLI